MVRPTGEGIPAPHRSPAGPPELSSGDGDPVTPRVMQILVVDDYRDAGETLQWLLEEYGHTVQIAHSGEEALQTVTHFQPDLVLCDLGLPGLDGFEVCRHLRGQPELQGLPIVAMTGYGNAEYRERASQAGFDHYLLKPITPEALRALLERYGAGPEGSG